MAVDGQGNLYVADTFNHRMQKLSPAGEPLAQWRTEGAGPVQFSVPSGVAVDGQGNIYVADSGTTASKSSCPERSTRLLLWRGAQRPRDRSVLGPLIRGFRRLASPDG